MIGFGVVSWSTRKESIVTMSTTMIEFIVATYLCVLKHMVSDNSR